MRCPYCGAPDTRVIDSRDVREGESIRRRRECAACSRRFTTYENVEMRELIVVKRYDPRTAVGSHEREERPCAKS